MLLYYKILLKKLKRSKNMLREYTKSLCMKQLIARRNSFDGTDMYENVFMSSICYLIKGTAHMRFFGNDIEASDNTLFYIPDGGRSRIRWINFGDGVEYIMLQAVNNYPEMTDKGFALQKVESMSNPETLARMEKIYNLLSTRDKVDSVSAIAEYYSLYSELLPLLAKGERKTLNPVLKKAVEYIEEHYCENFGLRELAAQCNISQSRLSHLFGDELGTSPSKLRTNLRIEKASILLTTTDDSIVKISDDCGFDTPNYFTQCFSNSVGMTPTEYRNGRR